MTTALKILIADDDADLRAALAEQLALHEEFLTVQTDTARGRSTWCMDRRPTSSFWTSVCRIWTDARQSGNCARKGLRILSSC